MVGLMMREVWESPEPTRAARSGGRAADAPRPEKSRHHDQHRLEAVTAMAAAAAMEVAGPQGEPSITTAEEEAMIQELLAGIGGSAAGGAATSSQHPHHQQEHHHHQLPMESQADVRDRLVLDAVCGGSEGWTTIVNSRDVDYVEQRPADGSYVASVSVVLSLVKITDALGTQLFMHDETGTGRVEGLASEADAEELATRRAVASARRRLAKRFAISLDGSLLSEIDRAARAQGLPKQQQPSAWRPPGKRAR